MGEFEEKLNAILPTPAALAQVANLAPSRNLGGQANSGGDAPPPDGGGERPPPGGGGPIPDLSGLSGLGDLLGQIDPKLLQKLLPLAGELTGNGGNDERLQLLYALRPFLKPERRDKVERAVKAARLIHVGKKLFRNLGDTYG